MSGFTMPWPVEPIRITTGDLNRLLASASEQGVSDVFLWSGNPVSVSLHGSVTRVGNRDLSEQEMLHLLNEISRNGGTAVQSGRDFDFRYEVHRPDMKGFYRFRVNITQTMSGPSATFRSITDLPPPLSALDVEPELERLLFFSKGLGLITGPTGSGKTTLLAAVLRYRLETEPINLLTFEAPIEFVFYGLPGMKGIVSQSEIPMHLPDFAAAVRGSLRRAPKVVLVGEARDKETIFGMVNEVRTGHAVYSTSHTESVAGTLDRLIHEFPPEEAQRAKMAIIDSLQVIVHQRLVPSVDGKRVAIREWLGFDADLREEINRIPIEHLTAEMARMVADRGRGLAESARIAMSEGKISSLIYQEVLASIGEGKKG